MVLADERMEQLGPMELEHYLATLVSADGKLVLMELEQHLATLVLADEKLELLESLELDLLAQSGLLGDAAEPKHFRYAECRLK
jgi:hypothetical protein